MRRRHENSGFGAKPGLPIHTTIPRSLAEVTASGKVHPLREVGLLEMSGIRSITDLKGKRVGLQATGRGLRSAIASLTWRTEFPSMRTHA